MTDAGAPISTFILLVEDERIVALAQAKALERSGYTVETVHDGAAAVAAIGENPQIGIVLMDIDLGAGIDGPEAARQILGQRDMPIVFLTSHTEQSYVDRVEAITRYGYVLKGAGMFTLLQSIKTALRLFDAHRTLQRSEARFRTLFENSPGVSIQGYAPDGTVLFWNRASETLYGYPAEEALGANLLDLIIPDDQREGVKEAIRKSVETGEPIPASELNLKRKDGSVAEVYSRHALLRYPDGRSEVFCLDVDIADRKRAEEALRRQETEYRTLIEQQSELLVRVDAGGAFEFVSDSYCTLFGKRKEELIGHSFMPLVHEDDREATRRAMEDLYHPPFRCRLEQRAWTVHGWRWLEWDDTAIVDDSGSITAIIGAGRDINERKEADAERRRILDSLPIPVVVSEGPKENVIVINDAFTALFGYTINDMPDAEHWFHLAYPDSAYRAEIQSVWGRAIADAEKTGGVVDPIIVNASAADGSFHTVSVRTHLLDGKKLITFTDLTEINAVQRQLEQSVAEKDRLMIELNHRVKNNLTLVASLIEMKEAELPEYVDLSDIRGQISAIGLIHEKLYTSGDTKRVTLGPYLADLLASVFSFYPGQAVQIENTGGDIELPTAIAVTVGVLVNELAINAMKHGFDPGIPPRFAVASEVHSEAGGGEGAAAGTIAARLVMQISNNGRPFPEEIDIAAPATLGLQLITALVAQLNATLELTRAPETRFAISFPL